jgi:hypothetical protein
MLDEISRDRSWIDRVGAIENPFGDGHSGRRIAQIIARVLHVSPADHALTGGRR